jgi:hypothetical protein
MANESTDDALVGIEAVADALRAEDFPMDKEGLAYSVGDIDVEDGRGGTIPVRVLLDRIEQDEFGSADIAIAAIRRAAHK